MSYSKKRLTTATQVLGEFSDVYMENAKLTSAVRDACAFAPALIYGLPLFIFILIMLLGVLTGAV